MVFPRARLFQVVPFLPSNAGRYPWGCLRYLGKLPQFAGRQYPSCCLQCTLLFPVGALQEQIPNGVEGIDL